jgi:transposase
MGFAAVSSIVGGSSLRKARSAACRSDGERRRASRQCGLLRLAGRRRTRTLPNIDVEIIRRPNKTKGFAVLPKRWVVERTLAWLGRRRLAKDFENLNRNALGFVKLASIRFMLRRLGRAS